MGLEATCKATLGGDESRGKALLETTELVFRGGFRVRVPFAEVSAVEVDGERLRVRFGGRALTLELGAAAARWADKIRNPPSRLHKLGVGPGARVALEGPVEEIDAGFLAELGARGAEVAPGAPRGPVDLVFYAAASAADLGRLAALRARIVPDGAIWVLRAKGPGTAVSEGDVFAAAKAAGLVVPKVAAFSATHTAAKLVIPVAERPRAAVTPARATARNRPRGRSTTPPARTPPRRAPPRGRRA
jgi:hypothetical protein